MKRVFVALFILSSSVCFSQSKLPIYVFGLSRQYCNYVKTFVEEFVFKLFPDSTFSLTATSWSSSFYPIKTKTVHSGIYRQKGDTLFLTDPDSQYYPATKEENYFKALAKDNQLQLFPAIIINKKGKMEYISYLNIPRELTSRSISFSEIDADRWSYSKDVHSNPLFRYKQQ